MPTEILDIIRLFATKLTVENGALDVYQIGDLYVILGEGTVDVTSILTSTSSPMTSTTMMSPTMTDTVMPTVFTSFSFLISSTSQGQTAAPSVSTIVIIYGKKYSRTPDHGFCSFLPI